MMVFLRLWIGYLRYMLSRIKNFIFYIFCFVLFVLILSFFKFSVVDGDSMTNTLKDKDLLLIFNSKDVKYKDIVAIESESLNKLLCKRVIGVAGDTVEVKEGVLTLNAEKVSEPYIREQKWGAGVDIKVTVPKGKLFVMGDNRNNSFDSRDLGLLNVDDVLGVLVVDITKYTGLRYNTLRGVIIVIWILLFIRMMTANKLCKKSNKDNSVD